MREIKFRAICLLDGKMRHGLIVQLEPNTILLDDDGAQWLISTETVGQFTGLKDKNGVDIYEGDIIENRPTKAPPSQHEIRWDEAGWAPFTYGTYDAHDSRRLIVIGTIHDNPELIK